MKAELRFKVCYSFSVTLPATPGSTTETYKRAPSIYGKLAYDKQIQEKVRFRGAASFYYNNSDGRSTLYGGDRTGSNYFWVMEPSTATSTANFFSGRINPGFSNQITALQLNGLVKAYGLELFGTFENTKGRSINEKVAKTDKRSVNQYAVDAIYRIGAQEKVYLGVRYNMVKGQILTSNSASQSWFLTKNILMKGEYVNQDYKDFPTGNIYNGGKFKGVVVQAVVGF